MTKKKNIRKNGAARKILAALLTLTLAVGLLPGFTLTAFAAGSAGSPVEIDIGTVSSGGSGYTFAAGTLTITEDGYYKISGSGSAIERRIVVQSGITADITLDTVKLDLTSNPGGKYGQVEPTLNCAFFSAGATTNLTLIGANELKSGDNAAGLKAPSGSVLTIGGTGSLLASSSLYAAGIGGGDSENGGDITINGGSITAIGSNSGAGIGGGGWGAGGDITINGGTIIATSSGLFGAGIGGGAGSAGGDITINGGTITATGSDRGAGIGGGENGSGGNITINGGTITATKGSVSNKGDIGPGYNGGNGIVKINGGSVNCTSAPKIVGTLTNGAGDNIYHNRLYKMNVLENLAITDIYGVSYGLDDVVADGNGYLYFWLPASSASEVIAVSSDGGMSFYGANYQRADDDTNDHELDLSLTRESTPNAAIDYADEELTGLVAHAAYTVNSVEKTADASSTIAIDSTWFNTTGLQIVRKSSDVTTYIDSTPQSLLIPARPSAPSGLSGVNETAPGLNDGKITGTDVTMEYAKSTAPTNWTDCSADETTGLAFGTYYVRYKAVTSGSPVFASEKTTVKITDGSAPVPPKNIKHKITFKANKGKLIKGAKAKKNVTENEKYGELPNAKRTHYTFEGWYTKKSGGKKILATTKVTVKKNQTLYAHWQKQHKFAKLNKGVSALNIHTQALAKSTTIGYLTQGNNIQLISKVDRKGKSKDWYKVKYKGKTAYIHAPFVQTFWK